MLPPPVHSPIPSSLPLAADPRLRLEAHEPWETAWMNQPQILQLCLFLTVTYDEYLGLSQLPFLPLV